MPLNRPNPMQATSIAQPIAPGGEIPGSEPASAEEQESYKKVVMAGLTTMFQDGSTKESILKRLKAGADNPPQALADIATMLITALDQKSKGTIPEVVILPAAAEILENAGQLANEAGIFEVNQNVIGEAAQIMVMSLAEKYGVEPAEIQELLDSMDQGSLDQIRTQQSQYRRVDVGEGNG